MKQIHDFAVKWCDKFRDKNINYIELVDHWMADDCKALGFEMDCGHAFSEKYGQAASNYEELDKIIDDVVDIPLLGSAIYSQWRYFNHWAYSGAEILEPKNRAWFILALSRLALLTGDNPFIFQGTPKKIHIVSNNICYGPIPEPDEEVEQHITIDVEGYVWFSGYNFGHTPGKYERSRSNNFKIEKISANNLLNAIAAYFGNEYIETLATDIGDWVMELTNTKGTTYKFRGSLCSHLDYEGTDLSDLFRATVGLDDLFVFDGNYKPDIINKIIVDYHRITKISPKEISENSALEFVTWDYTERLIIDRETDTIELVQHIGNGCKVSHKYEIDGDIESLLENFDAETLFTNIEEYPDDVIETPNDINDYTITIDYKRKPQKIITGNYDKYGLPEDFRYFAETVFDFIRFYDLGGILDPSIYGKTKRRKSDYIYCSVTFDEGYKSYYYITDDDSIEIGDFVIVPAGKDNHEAIVEVVDIEYYTEDKVPLPVEKTKHIIRKYTNDES